MEAADLDREIQAYRQLLPAIKQRYGSVWALVVHEKLVRTFGQFSEAARYVLAHHPHEQVLIRHTDEKLETAPFVQIDA